MNLFWVILASGLDSRSRGLVRESASIKLRKLLVDARKTAGLTQIDLSARLNRPQSFVSKYERGERRLDVTEFIEVARALKVNPTELFAELLGDAQ
jgi:transcriptional regulator with XRE-family HTH domain